MSRTSRNWTDDDVGSVLDMDQVEGLRWALISARTHHGWRLKDIARTIDQPEHSLSNFIRGRSRRPGNLFLGRLHKYLAEHTELFPTGGRLWSAMAGGTAAMKPAGGRARYGLVNVDVPISADDLRRVYKRYASYYFCFSILRGFDSPFVCSLLHIRPVHHGQRTISDFDLPLPRFAFMTEVPDRISSGRSRRYVVAGYVTSRNGKLFLTGQYDGELQYAILQEPRERRFQYIRGSLLTTLISANAPTTAKLICRRLGPTYDRSAWSPKVRMYESLAFRRTFEDADAIMASLDAPESHSFTLD